MPQKHLGKILRILKQSLGLNKCKTHFKRFNMLFEVYRDKQRLMHTEYKECIPSAETIKAMKAAGLKVLLDGKVYKTTKGK